MVKGFDVATPTTGHAHAIKAAGYGAVGIYLRGDRAPIEMVQGLISVGIRLFSIWEKGKPTDASYFTAGRGEADAGRMTAYAKQIGQPAGTPMFPCIDCDVPPQDIEEYVIASHRVIREEGFLEGLYGSGHVLAFFQDQGYSHYGYLAQARGWPGFAAYEPHAAIVQRASTTALGFDVDLDDVIDEAVLWPAPVNDGDPSAIHASAEAAGMMVGE